MRRSLPAAPPAYRPRRRPLRLGLRALGVLSLAMLVGCGGSAQHTVNLGFYTGVSVAPNPPVDRQNYTIQFFIDNLDEQDTTVANVQWSVARNGQTNAYAGTIASLASHQPVPITITDNEPPGTYVYTITIDPNNQIVETTKDDNILAVTVVVEPLSIE